MQLVGAVVAVVVVLNAMGAVVVVVRAVLVIVVAWVVLLVAIVMVVVWVAVVTREAVAIGVAEVVAFVAVVDNAGSACSRKKKPMGGDPASMVQAPDLWPSGTPASSMPLTPGHLERLFRAHRCRSVEDMRGVSGSTSSWRQGA